MSTGPQRSSDARKKKREFRGKYAPRRKVCGFCVDKIDDIDYKDVLRLRRYLSELTL